MLKLINTKILLAMLAAPSVTGSATIYQQHEAHKAVEPAARAAAIVNSTNMTPRSTRNRMRHSARR